jgi:hypothetical protein
MKMRPAITEFGPRSAADLFFNLKYARWRLPVRQKYQSFVENKYGIDLGGPGTLFPIEEMWSSFHDADRYGVIERAGQAPHRTSNIRLSTLIGVI